VSARPFGTAGATRRISRGLRLVALAFAFLQLGLQGALAVADGCLERNGAHFDVVHTESPSHTHQRVHDADCAICHVLTSGLDVPRRVAVLPPHADGPSSVPRDTRASAPHSALPGARLARAPPAAV
jgi:hypothetical protein